MVQQKEQLSTINLPYPTVHLLSIQSCSEVSPFSHRIAWRIDRTAMQRGPQTCARRLNEQSYRWPSVTIGSGSPYKRATAEG